VLHNYAHIFELLSRLRQALDHPYLVISGPSAHESSQQVASSVGNSDVCGVCHLDILSARDCAVASCRHTFHREVLID
jgi:DNA repair protein RAD16